MSRDGTEPIARDELFDILSNARRRYVLEYLSRAEGPVDFETLTEEVAAWETGTTVDALAAADRKRIYVSLYQCHLPRLQSAGIVRFDQEAGCVELTGRATEVARYISDDSAADRSPPWPLAYGAVSLVGLAAMAAAAADLGPFAGVPDLTVSTVGVLAVVLVAAAHTTARRGTSSDGVRLEAERQ